jgi:hypothetical protein
MLIYYHNCWVPGTDHAGAILATLGFSCTYIDQDPLISRSQTILLAELRVRLSVCDIYLDYKVNI